MTHIVINDYPYYTVKKFFISLPEALEYSPNKHELLNSRVYLLTSYNERVNDEGLVSINYGVDIQSRINK